MKTDSFRSGTIVLSVATAAACVWLVFTVRYTLRAGWDSDIMRQWKVSQYLLDRVNPWRLSYETLLLNYGPAHGPNRFQLKDLVIYEVNNRLSTEGIEGIRPDLGPPTATYPPSAELPIALTAGFLPQRTVLPVWLAVNLAALLILYRALFRDRRDGVLAMGSLGSIALTLLWPPVQEVFRTSQFVFLVMIFLLASLKEMDRRPIRSGLWLSLALIKPSLALPFLFIPLVKRKWIPFLVAAAIHGVATIAVCAWVREAPWVVLRQWMEIPRYMLQGAYTIQEFVNRLGLDNTAAGQLISLGFVAACGAWCWACRSAQTDRLAAFCAFIALLWTYHERYDFAILLLPLLTATAGLHVQDLKRGRMAALCLAYAALGLALTDIAYGIDHPACHAVRWIGRAAMYLLFLHAAWSLRASHAERPARRPENLSRFAQHEPTE